MRFGPTFSARLGTNRRPSWVSSPGTSASRGILDDLPAEHTGPELRQTKWIVGVDGQCQQSGEHLRTLSVGHKNQAP